MNIYKMTITEAHRELALGFVTTGINRNEYGFGVGRMLYCTAENALQADKKFRSFAEKEGIDRWLDRYTTTTKRANLDLLDEDTLHATYPIEIIYDGEVEE